MSSYSSNIILVEWIIDLILSEVSDENIRKIYFELFRKLKKVYFTSQYHQCKSTHIIFYDKEQECRDKNEHVEMWERGIIRFEVCVKKDHLKYKKYKKVS